MSIPYNYAPIYAQISRVMSKMTRLLGVFQHTDILAEVHVNVYIYTMISRKENNRLLVDFFD